MTMIPVSFRKKVSIHLRINGILEGLAQTEEHISENLDKYELGAAADSIYDFAWNSFCDWYIETAKGRL